MNENRMSAKEFNKTFGTNFKSKKANKFNSKSCWKDGVRYDSRFEVQLMNDLELRVKSGELKKIERQVKLSLDLLGYHISNYFCDFKLTYSDGTIEYLEAKSPVTETEVWKQKWRMAQAIYGGENVKFTVAKKMVYGGYKFEYYQNLKKIK